MTTSSSRAALDAGAEGLYALESGTGAAPRPRHVANLRATSGASSTSRLDSNGAQPASIDWQLAIAALDAGECPSSSAKSECSGSPPASPPTSPSSSAAPSPGSTYRNVGLLVRKASAMPPG